MKIILLFLMTLSSYAFAGLHMTPVDIKGFDKYPEQLQKIEESLLMIEDVINSDEFRQRIISFEGKSGKGFTSTQMTPEEVYKAIMEGRELATVNDRPGEMNFSLKRWAFNWPYKKKTVAESDARKNTEIKLSNWFYSWYDSAQMAGNITHEWIHLIGFSHADAEDHDSVPYAVGYIMRELAEKRVRENIESVLE